MLHVGGQGRHLVRYPLSLRVPATVVTCIPFCFVWLQTCLNLLNLVKKGRDEEGGKKQKRDPRRNCNTKQWYLDKLIT